MKIPRANSWGGKTGGILRSWTWDQEQDQEGEEGDSSTVPGECEGQRILPCQLSVEERSSAISKNSAGQRDMAAT